MTDSSSTRITDLAYSDACATWLDMLPGKPRNGIDYFVREARSAAREFVQFGCVAVDLQPGDATSYKMWLFDVERHAVEAGDYLGNRRGMVLVSLPFWGRGGSSYLFAVNGFHVPSYVGEKLDLDAHSATVMATFLTLFGAAVAETRS